MSDRPNQTALHATLMLTMVGATCSGGLRAQTPSLQHIERRHDQGDREAAIAALTRLLEARPRDVEAWLLMARLCNRQGDFAAAEQAARRAAELAPGSATASLELGVSFSRRGDEEAAREHLERAVAQSGGEVRLLAGRAAQRATDGDWDGAVADYDAALRLAPDSLRLQWGRGRALLGLGEFVLAADALDRARERWPPGAASSDPASSSAVCCDLAVAHFELGAGGRSLELLQQRLAIAPRDHAARLLRIRLATRLGRLDDAAADCRAGLSVDYDDMHRAELDERLGVVWLLRGDDAAARHALAEGRGRAALLRWALLFAGDPVAASTALPDTAGTPEWRRLSAFARDGEVLTGEGLDAELRCAIAFVAATRAAAAGRELEAEVEWLRAVNSGASDSPLVDVALSHLRRREGGALETGYGCDLVACDGGMRVAGVMRFGAAAEQGLRVGDVLRRIGRFDAELLVWLEQPGHHRVGLETVVVVRRDGVERTLGLRSGLQPAAAHRAFVAPPPAAKPH
ncbi:MAG: tetratricopeptide repeat protein [Planctomycetota bacterium]